MTSKDLRPDDAIDTSPYLCRRLRSLEEVLRQRAVRAALWQQRTYRLALERDRDGPATQMPPIDHK